MRDAGGPANIAVRFDRRRTVRAAAATRSARAMQPQGRRPLPRTLRTHARGGAREGWEELREFVSSNDFSDDANYEELARRVDLENLTAYMAVNMCLLNFDWPNNN